MTPPFSTFPLLGVQDPTGMSANLLEHSRGSTCCDPLQPPKDTMWAGWLLFWSPKRKSLAKGHGAGSGRAGPNPLFPCEALLLNNEQPQMHCLCTKDRMCTQAFEIHSTQTTC